MSCAEISDEVYVVQVSAEAIIANHRQPTFRQLFQTVDSPLPPRFADALHPALIPSQSTGGTYRSIPQSMIHRRYTPNVTIVCCLLDH